MTFRDHRPLAGGGNEAHQRPGKKFLAFPGLTWWSRQATQKRAGLGLSRPSSFPKEGEDS